MLDKPVVRCPENNYANQFCISNGCHHPSPKCNLQNCSACSNHENCYSFIKVQKFLEGLMKKGTNRPKTKDYILQLYNHFEKIISVDKQQYIAKNNAECIKLQGQQGKLFQLMTKGLTKQISTQLVRKVEKNLQGDSVTNNSIKVQERLIQNVEIFRKAMQKLLVNVKREWDSQVKVSVLQWKFNKALCAKKMEISSNMKSIKRTIQNDQLGYYAMISPSLEIDQQFKRIEFKIKKGDNGICFGIAFQDILKDNKFISDSKNTSNRGSYLVACGWTFSRDIKEQDLKQSELSYGEGDEIVMDLDMKGCRIIVHNKTKDAENKVVLDFVRQKDKKLYAVVLMLDKDDQVQIV